MSLVITPSRSSGLSSRQIMAISDDLPVPTGPAMPSRRDLVVVTAAISGTEQPLCCGGMDLGPLLDQWCAEGGDVVRVGEVCDGGRHRFYLMVRPDDPGGGPDRVHRPDLQCGGSNGLRLVVAHEAG